MRLSTSRRPIAVADLATCRSGDYIALWRDLPPGTAPPSESDPGVAAHLAARGLRPAIDDVGLGVIHTDEAEEMIAVLVRRAGKLAERIAAAEGGDDPASCKQAGDYVAFKVLIRLWSLPIDELRRRAALLDR